MAFARYSRKVCVLSACRSSGYVATSAMIVTRDRAEGFTLCAFAAAGAPKRRKVWYSCEPLTAKELPDKHGHPDRNSGAVEYRSLLQRNLRLAALGSRYEELATRDLHSPSPAAVEAHAPVNQRKDCVIATKPTFRPGKNFVPRDAQ